MAGKRPMTLRLITRGSEMMVARMWPFQDVMAARPDVGYTVHLLGEYGGDLEQLRSRAYVKRRLPVRRADDEVWLLRGWNKPNLVAAAYAARARRIPLMLWHEPPGRTWEASTISQAARIRVRKLLLPQTFRAYRGCVLLGIGELAARRFAELAPGSHVHVLPYPDHQADELLSRGGAEPEVAEPDVAEPDVAEPEVAERAVPRLLFVGEFSPRKGVDLLAAACEDLWREGARFELRYVGGGPSEQLLREHASRSGGRAEVLGALRGDALLDLFGSCDGFVLPSRWDGWGLVVHEALAAGLPVVVSDACGAKMLVGDCGVVFGAGDPGGLARGLRWCISLTRRERDAIRSQGREAAAAITMDRIGDALVAHAREALALA